MASKPKTGSKLIRPWLCVMGVMFLWASQNQPPVFAPPALAVWALSSVSVGLIAGAICAFVQPLALAVGRASRDMTMARAGAARAGAAQADEARAGEARATHALAGKADEP